MKKIIPAFIMIILLTSMEVQKPVRVIFFGDSITQAGVKPGGYITLMQQAANKSHYEFIGAGIGGNKVYDLFLRMEEDVLNKKPDIVVIYVGVNDIWHKQTHQTGTDLNKFTAFYTAMVERLQAKGINVFICTPAVIGERTDFSNAMDGDLNLYSNSLRKLAEKYSCGLIDLRKEFLEYNLKNNTENAESGILTTDRVHLNAAGNQLLANLMLKKITGK